MEWRRLTTLAERLLGRATGEPLTPAEERDARQELEVTRAALEQLDTMLTLRRQNLRGGCSHQDTGTPNMIDRTTKALLPTITLGLRRSASIVMCGPEMKSLPCSLGIPVVLRRARQWARTTKRDVLALWLAARDPRVPWYVKAMAGAVAAYALSPIDLIPDFVPVLGYLDDLVIVPTGILLTVRVIPAPLMAEFRAEAARREGRPASRAGLVVVLIWVVTLAVTGVWLSAYIPN